MNGIDATSVDTHDGMIVSREGRNMFNWPEIGDRIGTKTIIEGTMGTRDSGRYMRRLVEGDHE